MFLDKLAMVRAAVLASVLVLASADDFEDFNARYGKTYNNADVATYEAVRATYEANMQKVAEQNAKDQSLKFGENQFADLTVEQYNVEAGFGNRPTELMGNQPYLGVHVQGDEALADSIDWRAQGAVTPVKDQGGCGSCWAFSAIGAIESAWIIAGGARISMSEQQILDCDRNVGCKGGSALFALAYESGVDVCSQKSYPYKAKEGSCKSGCTVAMPAGSIIGVRRLNLSGTATASQMMSAIQQQPVSVSVSGGQESFKLYKSGVLSSGCGGALNHATVVVGYGNLVYQNSLGVSISEGYWLVKNSWGKTWGQDGYIMISQSGNTCGILSAPVYPAISRSVAV